MPIMFLTGTTTTTPLSDVASTLSEVISWIGTVLTALIGSNAALGPIWPFVMVGFSVTIIMLAVKVLRSFSWGI